MANIKSIGIADGMRFVNKYRSVALFGIAFSAVLYFMMMSLQLTNTFDGLWQQNYHHAGIVELTSGRWLLPFIDKLDMGLHAEPIASLAALFLFIVGFIFILELFGIRSKLIGCLCLALFVSSAAVSNTLSYRFTSLGYSFAYLSAVLSVYTALRIKRRLIAVLTSGILLGLSMACYQAYLSVFCIVAVIYIYILYILRRFGTQSRGEAPGIGYYSLSRLLVDRGRGLLCRAAVSAFKNQSYRA